MDKEIEVKVKIDTTEIRKTLQEMADKAKNMKSNLDFILFLARRTLPKNASKLIFLEWLSDNINRIPEACNDLGIEVPEGSDFAARLEKAVVNRLKPETTVISTEDLLKGNINEK